MTIIVEINGQKIPVDDAFKNLTPEQQEMEKAYIAEQLSNGVSFGGGAPTRELKEPTTVAGLPVALAPEAGAAMGATMGAAFGPAAGEVLDKGAAQVANAIRPTPANTSPNAPQSVRNWLATQTSTPYSGGRDYEEAKVKADIAGSKPVQSRGSSQGIRRGGLGIDVQPPAETLPQKAAANLLNAERMPKPGITRRIGGMSVAGGELGNMAKEFDEGNYGRAALSGVGAVSGVASQSRIKPVRAIGTAMSMGIPAIQKFLLKDEDQSNIQEKAAGGSVTSPKLKSLSDFLDQLMQQAASAPTPAPAPQGAPQGAPQQGGVALPPEMQQAALQQAPGMGAQPPSPQGNLPSAPAQAPMPQMARGGKVGALESLAKKFHEVLTPHEGKTLLATLADRTKATDGFQGGPGFINLNPDYTWAVDAPAVGKKHMEAVERFGGPKQTVMAPMLMSKEAHKSNRPVFEQIYSDVLNKVKTGELSKEQIDAINQRIAIEKKADLSKNPGIESPDFLEFANAFNRRGALADIFGLKKLGATDLQKHLDDTIDPALKEASTGSVGPQLFTMSGYENAPGIHGGYNIGFRGEKGVDQFIPAEREFVFRDLEKQANQQMGRPMTDYNYRNILKEHGGIPNQIIDEKLLRGLQEVGRKKGGLV